MHPSARAGYVLMWVLTAATVLGQDAAKPSAPESPTTGDERSEAPATAPAAEDAPSEAERITRLERVIKENEKQLTELHQKIEDPKSEYAEAEAEFKAIDQRWEEAKKKLQAARDAGRSQEVESLQTDLADTEKQRKLARDRFDLAIQERKTLQEQANNLEQKLKQDKAALDKLLAPPATQPAAAGGPATTTAPAETTEAPAKPAVGVAAAPPGALATPPATPDEQAAPAGEAAVPQKPPSEELVKAKEELQAKEAEAQAAEEEVRSVTERIAQVEKAIAAQKKLVETARLKAQNAEETEQLLTEQVQKQSADGASLQERQATWDKIRDARGRQQAAEKEVEEQQAQLDKLREDLAQLQTEQITALQQAESKQEELAESQKKVEAIENPFSLRNLLQWLIIKGPRILGILIAIFLLLWLTHFLTRRITALVAARAERGSMVEREQRAKTLAEVFHSTANTIIVAGGAIMVLQVADVPIAPLLGGAAVVGLAVAFGAQNLIRDYFTGFIILLENQYTINDVVKIAGIGGLVERITLRVTVLRDLEGVVHFIPNGQITTVSNMTHHWSRALFDIGVAYKENVDQVIEVLLELAREARQDPKLGPLILADAEMLGVDEFADSAVVIKFFIKTRPLQQWTVKREMLRRIKNRFDELGIEIPFPHRTVYHRTEEGHNGGAMAGLPPRE